MGWICALVYSSAINPQKADLEIQTAVLLSHVNPFFLLLLSVFMDVQLALAHYSLTWSPLWPCSAWTLTVALVWDLPSSGPCSSPPALSYVGTDLCIKHSGVYQKCVPFILHFRVTDLVLITF